MFRKSGSRFSEKNMRKCNMEQSMWFVRLLAFACLAALSLGSGPLRAQPAPTLPAGEGRDLVANVCTGCHGLGTIVQIRDGAAGWRQFVNYMVMKGAQVSAQDSDTIVRYLTANFGPDSAPQPGAPPPAVVSLPQGSGKELIEARCVTCHDLTRIVTARRHKADWEAIVANMGNRGATATPDERATIVAYLASQFGE
jgi:mono/diheme cytochrome c family protein